MKVALLVIAVILLVLQLVKTVAKFKGVPTPDWVEIVMNMLNVAKYLLQLLSMITPV